MDIETVQESRILVIMEISIRKMDKDTIQDANKCDAAFTVDSKLVLRAEDGVVSYQVVSVKPYQKRYVFEERDYSAYISNPDKIVYFAYANDQLAGQINVAKHWNAYAWIDDFAVNPLFRGHGVGRALMQKAVDWTKEKNLPGIMLETQDVNVPACRFYQNFGFKLHGFDTYLYKGLNPSTDEIALYWYLIF
jgi:GNAT superfamily N-acetyltransferase